MTDIVALKPRQQPRAWLDYLSSEIAQYNFNYSNEADLQNGLRQVFETIDSPFKSEYKLSDKDRIDFYWPDSKIGVEVKISHPLAALTRQVHRYLQHEEISGILIVSGRVRLNQIPQIISGKPVQIHSLIGSLL